MRNLIYIIVAFGLLMGCKGKPGQVDSDKPVIMVTIEPLRYFTEAIAGDNFHIVSMVPKGTSPETYDPTPQQMVSLGKSMAYFKIGYIGFEQVWMQRIEKNTPGLKIFDTSAGIELIYEEGHYHGDHYHATGVEPHIWNSPVNARIIAANILSFLTGLDKENASSYQERYHLLLEQINHTEREVHEILSHNADSVFMIYHPALSYFARDYGLKQIPIEKDGKEPSSSYLKQLITLARHEGVRVIFVQPEFPVQNAQLIAKETNTEIVQINPIDYEWHDELVKTAKALCHE